MNFTVLEIINKILNKKEDNENKEINLKIRNI